MPEEVVETRGLHVLLVAAVGVVQGHQEMLHTGLRLGVLAAGVRVHVGWQSRARQSHVPGDHGAVLLSATQLHRQAEGAALQATSQGAANGCLRQVSHVVPQSYLLLVQFHSVSSDARGPAGRHLAGVLINGNSAAMMDIGHGVKGSSAGRVLGMARARVPWIRRSRRGCSQSG